MLLENKCYNPTFHWNLVYPKFKNFRGFKEQFPKLEVRLGNMSMGMNASNLELVNLSILTKGAKERCCHILTINTVPVELELIAAVHHGLV